MAKTPHFHLLSWCTEWWEMDWHELEHKLKTDWCRITEDGGPDRYKFGCQLIAKTMNSPQLKNYMLAHHNKKTDQEACKGGKHWGILGRRHLALGQYQKKARLTAKQRAALDRISRRLLAERTGSAPRDNSRFKEVRLVLDGWDQRRLLKHILELT